MQTSRILPRLVLFTFIRTVINTAHRMVYPFLASFARGLGADLALLSYALTGRAVMGAFGPLAASLADRRGRKFGMVLGLSVFTLGAAVVAFRPSFLTFSVALLMTALGKYIFDPALIAWLGDRVVYERRGRILAFIEFGWSLAFILGVPLVGFLIARRGWNSPFQILVLLGVMAIIILYAVLPRDVLPQREQQPGAGGRSPSSLGKALASLPVLAGLSVGFFISASNETVNLVFGVWLEGAFGLQIAALGAASAVIGLSELGGEGLVAAFVDRLGKSRAVLLGITANSLAALALPWLGRTEAGAMTGLFFFYISFEFTLVSSIPLMTEVMPAARATVLALNVAGHSLGRALGALSGPLLYQVNFPAVTLGAILFNLLAFLGLQILNKKWEGAKAVVTPGQAGPESTPGIHV